MYPSNLSAALYELGDYLACFQAICRTVAKLQASQEDSISLLCRLSIGLAKTLCHGCRDDTIKRSQIEEGQAVVSTLQALAIDSDEGSDSELSTTWSYWRKIEAEGEPSTEQVEDARCRLTKLSLYKQAIQSNTMNYYSVGHDDPLSIVDDHGERRQDQSDQNPMDLGSLSDSQRSRLAFMFGGVGDARHAYSSMIGLHKAYNKLKKEHQANLHVHLTLLDVHPTVLARDLVIMMLLDGLLADDKRYLNGLELLETNGAQEELSRHSGTIWEDEKILHLSYERLFFQATHAFGPHPTLSQPKEINDAWAILRKMADGNKMLDFKEAFWKAREHTEAKWKPNMTLFSLCHEEDKYGGYPPLMHDPFQTILSLLDFNKRMGIHRTDNTCPSYSIASTFFDAVADGLKDMKGKVQWEIIHGDMFEEMMKMKYRGKDDLRPERFPRTYMRIWQSNVPDYLHGPLNSAIYAAPNLEHDPVNAAASANCMLNSVNWDGGIY
ncbi:hypothetical protein D9758_007757 [Tetrapyrgos nigripes]|uniref:DUF4470 domain-containing protein n=1 Tax=Tetrapyrgos nigripes TaxID=182062 RepID=A0A8H5LIU4_9AGAR|nr:hypothetical protein D9758_007757 [Tetrapyrgos nigripes]